MERFVKSFGRNTDRTVSRSGFRVGTDKPITVLAEETKPDEPIAEPAIQCIEPVKPSLEVIEEQPVITENKAANEIEQQISYEVSESKPRISFDDFLSTVPVKQDEEISTPIEKEEVVAAPQQKDIAWHTESEFEAAKKTIDMLTQAIAEKDEYIAKLKEYAQVTDDELKLAREQNKTLLEVTGKFVMKF